MGRSIRSKTQDISPGGLLLISKLSLTPGTPLTLRFRFGGACHLNISAQVTFCVTAQQPRSKCYSVGIKFAGIRDWEQLILLSALKEIKEAAVTRRTSLLTISVSNDRLASEAADYYIDQPGGHAPSSPVATAVLLPTLSDLLIAEYLPQADSPVPPLLTGPGQLEAPSHSQQGPLPVPTFSLLIDGQELNTNVYRYAIYADKLIADSRGVLSVLKELNSGHVPAHAHEYVYAQYCIGLKDTNERAIEAASRASQEFRSIPVTKRLNIARDIHDLLHLHKDRLIDLMVMEGHPRRLAEWEFWGMEQAYRKEPLDFYRQNLTKRIAVAKHEVVYWKRKPDGVVCVSPPRNAPCSSSLIAGFALLAGNALIVKPPLRAPVSTLYLWTRVVNEALKANQAPPGTLNVVVGNSDLIMDEWIASPFVNDVLFIGDSKTGLEIGHRAFLHGKKPILELSGNDMMFVWKDAELAGATQSLLDAFMGSTQICMVPKKAFVHEEIYDAFETRFLEQVKTLKVGLPSDPAVTLSPVVKIADFYEFLEDALSKGAQLLCGGTRVNHQGRRDDRGQFIMPAVIRINDVRKAREMRCIVEENFFPLIPLVRICAGQAPGSHHAQDMAIFKTMAGLANANEYGLRISAWVRSLFYRRQFVEHIDNSGLLRINRRHIGFSPFLATHGGTGKSGGPFGEMNYVWQKTTHLQGVTVARTPTGG